MLLFILCGSLILATSESNSRAVASCYLALSSQNEVVVVKTFMPIQSDCVYENSAR